MKAESDPHLVYCNADHRRPLGCDMCICLRSSEHDASATSSAVTSSDLGMSCKLSGDELDAAVARIEGYAEHLEPIAHWFDHEGRASTDWRVGGPIIERERIDIYDGGGVWCAEAGDADIQFGETALIAAMRAFVASHAKPESVEAIDGTTIKAAG